MIPDVMARELSKKQSEKSFDVRQIILETDVDVDPKKLEKAPKTEDNRDVTFTTPAYRVAPNPNLIDKTLFTNKYVKLVVVNKKDILKFDKFVEAIYTNNPIELKIIEDFSEFEASALDDSIDLEDTMTLLSDYVDSVETDSDKERLKTLLKTLYVEAQHYNEA
jgi:hypothetical protein